LKVDVREQLGRAARKLTGEDAVERMAAALLLTAEQAMVPTTPEATARPELPTPLVIVPPPDLTLISSHRHTSA